MTRVSEDEVHKDIAHLLMIMSQYYRIIFVSGRDDSCSVDTIQWIKDNTYSCYPMSTKLHMRDVWDNRNDAIVKYEIAQRLNKDFNIRYVFDDRDRVVKMWREAGFRCLQVANWNF
jgi:acid phosphatase class B